VTGFIKAGGVRAGPSATTRTSTGRCARSRTGLSAPCCQSTIGSRRSTSTGCDWGRFRGRAMGQRNRRLARWPSDAW